VKTITFNVNGVKRSFSGDPDMPLLGYLRDTLGLVGTRFRCRKGLCGTCTVHIDGEAVRSCITQMKSLAGKSILTIEGLGAGGEHPLQQAWKTCRVPQCGYCQNGQLMRAAALLAKNPHPSDPEIEEAMLGNICYCGTYRRIRQAIKLAAGMKS
jgi:isoquinoline 1-oxidoreductase alpha subunit